MKIKKTLLINSLLLLILFSFLFILPHKQQLYADLTVDQQITWPPQGQSLQMFITPTPCPPSITAGPTNVPASPTPPQAAPSPTQAPSSGGSASNNSNPPSNNSSSSSSSSPGPAASQGEVLGATTLASTGNSKENIAELLIGFGTGFFGIGFIRSKFMKYV